jgi:CheY-like chemotaxis protein
MNPSFVRELRRALHHLYDWGELGRSPLVGLFGVEQRMNSSSTLRGILTEAIESLKPNANVSSTAKVWRTYQLLHSRYVEQFTQREVASELGLSIRHLRREEALALQTLAAYLWDHYNVGSRRQDQEDMRPTVEEEDIFPADAQTPTQKQELEWVRDSLPSQPADVAEVIRGVLKLVSSLARASDVHVDFKIPENLPHWIMQLTPVRQALLSIFTIAIGRVPGGAVSIRARVNHSEVSVYVQAKSPRHVSDLSNDEIETLEVARQLVELSGGALEIALDGEKRQPFAMKITLPAEEQVPVLVIDDNVDTLRLLQRYLSNSRYRFIGTSDPQQALQLAKESCPQIIVLDVMLPDIDGWELLGRLHEHPQTRDIPMIVCTILPQEQLSLSLGATAFVRKPISRQSFLSALDHQLVQLSRESC